jgi:hypothetical protein
MERLEITALAWDFRAIHETAAHGKHLLIMESLVKEIVEPVTTIS